MRYHFFLCAYFDADPDHWSALQKMDPCPNTYLKFTLSFFPLICMQKLSEPFIGSVLLISFLLTILISFWEQFFWFLVDILSLISGSVNPHIFADPDPGSQNDTDPTDPDPEHCFFLLSLCKSDLDCKDNEGSLKENIFFSFITQGTVANLSSQTLNGVSLNLRLNTRIRIWHLIFKFCFRKN